MVFKSFRIQCIVRSGLLAASMFLLVYLIQGTSLFATSILVGGAVIAQVIGLIRYVEGSNRNLTRFLESIRYSDFAHTFLSDQKGRSFKQLNDAFSNVVAEFQKARAEKEEQFRYLQTVIQHIGLGILSFEADGRVDLINNAAKRLLQVTHLTNIRSLDGPWKPLAEALEQDRPGDKMLIKIETDRETLTLALHTTKFWLSRRPITLVSMQNIESELTEQEMLAWQKLIRVLTHEIMNSVTPIASLASTINGLVSQTDAEQGNRAALLDADTRQDIGVAAGTIEKRSQGLLRFVNAYRNLTRIPPPDFDAVAVTALLGRIARLMKDRIERAGIKLLITVDPEDLKLIADPELVEQVLINLILNAVQAFENVSGGEIEITARLNERGRVIITVADNGPGISEDIKDKLFTPFFTTKKGGSGIGLSLSRQIMSMHKGTIAVKSFPGQRTVFRLRF